MPVHPLSTRPYGQVARAGTPVRQRQRILDIFEARGAPLNRRMIAALSHLPINVVCWRVKGMLDGGLLRVQGVGRDPVTGQETEFLEATGLKVRQMELAL